METNKCTVYRKLVGNHIYFDVQPLRKVHRLSPLQYNIQESIAHWKKISTLESDKELSQTAPVFLEHPSATSKDCLRTSGW